jgi:hypothetical protein
MGYDGEASNFMLNRLSDMRALVQVQVEEDGNEVDVPEEFAGVGWFDARLETLQTGIRLATAAFYASPREWDKEPNDIPPDHPLRAIAKVFDEAPRHSDIR